MKKQEETDIKKRKLVQVTWQVYEDQKEALMRLSSKEASMQFLVRKALDANGICDTDRLSA